MTFKILEDLNLGPSSNSPGSGQAPTAAQGVMAPVLSQDAWSNTVERECARRTFWLVHMIELLGATFTRRPMMYKKEDLEGVRLPCDEASFDLALEAEPGLFFLLSFLLRHDRGYTK